MKTEVPPERACEVLLAQHAQIRRLLVDVETSAALLVKAPDDQAPLVALQTATLWLREGLLAHMEAEEALLEPVLERTVEGRERLGLLRTEHASQRALLDVLATTGLPGVPRATLAWRYQWMIKDLLEDMALEELDLFARFLAPVAGQLHDALA